jgi:hypothetical protein
MPLFEIVLLHGESSEVRLTDRPTTVGDTVQINDEDWVVVRSVPASGGAEARLECVKAVRQEPTAFPPG